MHIDPTPAQVERFVADADADGGAEPIFMLNLLRFQADGGQEAYATYAAAAQPHLARVGAQVQWAGACDAALIGPGDPEWDIAAVVRYPSRAAFLAMIQDPDYLAITHHRTAGLADSRLIPCTGTTLGG